MYKNVASQKVAVFAWDAAANAPKTGDAANITARISKDGAAVAQSNDVAPTELDATHAKGIYLFDLTQAESNCNLFVLSPVSSTTDIQLEPVREYTTLQVPSVTLEDDSIKAATFDESTAFPLKSADVDGTELARVNNVAEAVEGRTVRYVSTGGDDANDGTSWDEAYLTLQAAVTASSHGDLIIVGPGSFAGQADASAKNKLTFRGAGRGQTILTHNATNTILVGDATTLTDLRVANTQASPPTTEGVAICANGADDFVMRRVDVDTDGTGVSLAGSFVGMAEITDCHVTAAEYGVNAYGGSAATAWLVVNNSVIETIGWSVCDSEAIRAGKVQLIVHNSDVESSVASSQSGKHSWAIYAWYGAKASIYNSRVFATDATGSGTYQAGLLVGDTASARAFDSDIRCEGAGSECYDIKNYATNDDLPAGNVEYDPDKTDGTITIVSTVLADSEDVYHADIGFIRDQTNVKDEYTVSWFKNGAPVTSGVTLPKIQVVKRADGTDLIAEQAMTEVGSTAAYWYDGENTERQTVGESVVVYVKGTIDGAVRSWRRPIGRDSE